PYIPLVFHDKNDNNTRDYSLTTDATNRIMDIQHHEKMYDGYAFIVLRNNDRTIPDLRGWWVEIGYGADTSNFGGSGNESEKTARLWVTNQQSFSAPGVVVTHLILEDIWRRWARLEVIFRGVAPYFQYNLDGSISGWEDTTPYGILEWLIETNLAQFDLAGSRAEMAGTLDALGDQDDGIINTQTPYFPIHKNYIETGLEIAQRALGLTKCYLRTRKSINFEVRYPQASDAVDAIYYSDQVPYFHEYVETESVLVPNYVLIFGNAGEDGLWTDFIWAQTPESLRGDNEELVSIVVAMPFVTDQGELETYRDAYIHRLQNRRVAGRLIIRHDPRLEIHDKLMIFDSRET
ncbi:hypothetical protein LCGC14_2874070, partial [marine sediment metagenome]